MRIFFLDTLIAIQWRNHSLHDEWSVLNDETVDHIVNATVPGRASDEAPFKIDTIAMAEEGKTISGDDLYELIQEAKAKNVTVASLMHKLPNAKARVIVTPGPGVVELALRTGRRKDA